MNILDRDDREIYAGHLAYTTPYWYGTESARYRFNIGIFCFRWSLLFLWVLVAHERWDEEILVCIIPAPHHIPFIFARHISGTLAWVPGVLGAAQHSTCIQLVQWLGWCGTTV